LALCVSERFVKIESKLNSTNYVYVNDLGSIRMGTRTPETVRRLL